MSKPLRIEIYSGGNECFQSKECPIYTMFLLHLRRARHSNVYEQRLGKLTKAHPGLIDNKEKHGIATLTCRRKSCPTISKGKFKEPVVKVFNLRIPNKK